MFSFRPSVASHALKIACFGQVCCRDSLCVLKDITKLFTLERIRRMCSEKCSTFGKYSADDASIQLELFLENFELSKIIWIRTYLSCNHWNEVLQELLYFTTICGCGIVDIFSWRYASA